jgi:hypothetical protein
MKERGWPVPARVFYLPGKKPVDAGCTNRVPDSFKNLPATQSHLKSAFGHALWCGYFASAVCSTSNSVAPLSYFLRHEPLDVFRNASPKPRHVAASNTLATFAFGYPYFVRINQS